PNLEEALQRLRAALALDPPRSRWVQLATADEGGIARVRTVVLHDVDGDGVLSIATDAASGKCRDLRVRPRAEVCVLSRERLEQHRVLARFEVVDAARSEREVGLGERRRALWRSLEPREKGYYLSPPPGLELNAFPADALKAEAHEPDPVPRFALLLGAIERI